MFEKDIAISFVMQWDSSEQQEIGKLNVDRV